MGALLQDLLLARSPLERYAELRSDATWIANQYERGRVVLIAEGQVAVVESWRLLELEATAAPPALHTSFLGLDPEETPIFSAHLTSADPEWSWSGIREIGAQLDARASGVLVTAVALDNWHRTHQHCSRCGARTEVVDAGWARRCPVDGSQHFPRTDPAIIVLAIDQNDRALLGRQGRWQPTWFSTLAGFVEPGESAEHAVRREVREEAGVVVGAVDYLGSQPWPFPGSLMLGYHAWAEQTAITVDGQEIVEAHWFSRDELRASCLSGDVRLPPAISIARKLIERWFGSPIEGDWSRP